MRPKASKFWKSNIPSLQCRWRDEGGTDELEISGIDLDTPDGPASTAAEFTYRGKRYVYRYPVVVSRQGRRVLVRYEDEPKEFKRWGLEEMYKGTVELTYGPHSRSKPTKIIWRADGWPEEVLIEEIDWAFFDQGPSTTDLENRRSKLTYSRYERPDQALLRATALAKYGRCAVSGCAIPECLDLAHIVPVKNHGIDHLDNVLLLRTDLHRLFDAGLLRFRVDDGECIVTLDDSVKAVQPYDDYHNRPTGLVDWSRLRDSFSQRTLLEESEPRE